MHILIQAVMIAQEIYYKADLVDKTTIKPLVLLDEPAAKSIINTRKRALKLGAKEANTLLDIRYDILAPKPL